MAVISITHRAGAVAPNAQRLLMMIIHFVAYRFRSVTFTRRETAIYRRARLNFRH